MDNLQRIWFDRINIRTSEYGKPISCSYAEDIACFITDNNCIVIYRGKPHLTEKAKRITEKEELRTVHYLQFYDRIFVSMDSSWCIFNGENLETIYTLPINKASELCWNPTDTTVAVTFGSDDISLYSYNGLEVILRHGSTLHADIDNSLYVGWGSKSTQYQAPKQQTQSVEELKQNYDPPKIVWREDGEQLAVNFSKGGHRFIKVFDRDLFPLYMSKVFLNLGSTLSFDQKGLNIACTAVCEDSNYLVIFETNCRLKEVFKISHSKGLIKKVEFNPYMNLLAVWSVDESNNSYLNIYLRTNGKWILKHQCYYKLDVEVIDFMWTDTTELPYTIRKLVVFTSNAIEYHTFRFIVNRWPHNSIVGVIEGSTVCFYDYQKEILPPPKRKNVCHFDNPIILVMFNPVHPLAAVVDSKFELTIVEVKDYSNTLVFHPEKLKTNAYLNKVVWHEYQISIHFRSDDPDEQIFTKNLDDLSLEITTAPIELYKSMFPYDDTHNFICYKEVEDQCSLIYLTQGNYRTDGEDISFDFALTSSGELLINNIFVCSGVTSLFIDTGRYLLFTLAQGRLYCVRIYEAFFLFTKPFNLSNMYSREIEQGARIVTVSNSYPPRIILQTPRGNLETVICKMITVDAVCGHILQGQYEAALEIIRLDRINSNILIDFNPDAFTLRVTDIIVAAQTTNFLVTIVNEFGDIDTEYKTYLPKVFDIVHDKKEFVTLVLEKLTDSNFATNLKAIVAILHKHYSVRSALSAIQNCFDDSTLESIDACRNSLQYLLSKEDKLGIIRNSYTLYDLDFLMFVYTISREDPRFYHAEVDRLRGLSELDLRFQMNLTANRPHMALKYLLRCDDDYDEDFVRNFIVGHNFQEYAWKVLPTDCYVSTMVVSLYAEQLSQKKKYAEAALILKRASLYEDALQEYIRALDWMETIPLMKLVGLDENSQNRILYSLSENLVKRHRLDEAMVLLEFYLKDYIKAVQVLIDQKAFKRAIYLIDLHDLTNMKDDLITHLHDHVIALSRKIKEYANDFKKYSQRLQVVRENRKFALDTAVGSEEFDDSMSDIQSVSSITSTRSSRSQGSTMSSRNRRKEEKKKINPREGGVYEDIALIRLLHILYTEVFSLSNQVNEVIEVGSNFHIAILKGFHNLLSELQEDMKNKIPDIWPYVFVNMSDVVDNYILSITCNRNELDPKYRMPPSEELLKSKLKLSIFGNGY